GRVYSRALATASLSTPANTVVSESGFLDELCRAHLMPGRAAPAAHPHTELITSRVVPFCSFNTLSTSSGVLNSRKPTSVRSARMGATNCSGYISSYELRV